MPELRRRHFLLFAAIYLYAFPYFDGLRSAQEMPRLLLTQQIVDHGVLNLDARLGELQSRNDLSRGPDGHWYANKTPGPSFVAIPAYLVCKLVGARSIKATMWAFRVGAITIPALLFLPFFYRLTRRFTPDEHARRAALAAYALGSPVVPYSMVLYAHMLAAVGLGGAFYICVRLTRDRVSRPALLALAAGALAGMAPSMDYQAALAAPAIGLFLLIRSRARLRDAACFAAGALPPLAGLAAYHTACFGSPTHISYGYGVDRAPETGVMGFIGPNRESFYHTLISPSNGLITLAPWVLLALVGARAILRDPERRALAGAEVRACLAVVAIYVVFLGSMLPYMARGGWSAGPRQLVATLPFLGWLSAPGFALAARRLGTRALSVGVVVSAAMVFLSMATTYPHLPDAVENPLYELVFRLIWHGYAVHSIGTAVGLSGVWATLPLYLLAAGTLFWLLLGGTRRPVLVGVLGCAIALLIVGSYRLAPLTGRYADHVWSYVTATWEPRPARGR